LVYPAPLADFLGVSLISSDTDLFSWEPRPTGLPLVTAGQRPVFLERETVLSQFRHGDFRPTEEVFLPLESAPLLPVKEAARARVGGVFMTPHTMVAEVEAEAQTMVVISQTFSPCWKARINGRKVPLWRANHAFQALVAPAGRSEVKLTYEDRLYELGGVLSLLFLAGSAVGIVWGPARPLDTTPADTLIAS
jgi:hypothetical protein